MNLRRSHQFLNRKVLIRLTIYFFWNYNLVFQQDSLVGITKSTSRQSFSFSVMFFTFSHEQSKTENFVCYLITTLQTEDLMGTILIEKSNFYFFQFFIFFSLWTKYFISLREYLHDSKNIKENYND